jgi:hypothetical protein
MERGPLPVAEGFSGIVGADNVGERMLVPGIDL